MKDIKFIQPVSMVITKERFRENLKLKSELKKLGYNISDCDDSMLSVLVTNFALKHNSCATLPVSANNRWDRYFIDHYNPELFLALAAMTEGDIPIVGEYMISLKTFSGENDILNFKKGELVKVLSMGEDYKYGKGDFTKEYDRNYFRKATKEEIINWFTIKKEMETKEINIEIPEGYEVDKDKSTFTNIVFKPIEKKYPTSIKEVKGRNVNFDVDGFINVTVCDYDTNLSTTERAEAVAALIQLLELRDAWNKIDGFEVDYLDEEQLKYVIYIDGDKITSGSTFYGKEILSFGSDKTRDLFLGTFKDLIETAKEFL